MSTRHFSIDENHIGLTKNPSIKDPTNYGRDLLFPDNWGSIPKEEGHEAFKVPLAEAMKILLHSHPLEIRALLLKPGVFNELKKVGEKI